MPLLYITQEELDTITQRLDKALSHIEEIVNESLEQNEIVKIEKRLVELKTKQKTRTQNKTNQNQQTKTPKHLTTVAVVPQ